MKGGTREGGGVKFSLLVHLGIRSLFTSVIWTTTPPELLMIEHDRGSTRQLRIQGIYPRITVRWHENLIFCSCNVFRHLF